MNNKGKIDIRCPYCGMILNGKVIKDGIEMDTMDFQSRVNHRLSCSKIYGIENARRFKRKYI